MVLDVGKVDKNFVASLRELALSSLEGNTMFMYANETADGLPMALWSATGCMNVADSYSDAGFSIISATTDPAFCSALADWYLMDGDEEVVI